MSVLDWSPRGASGIFGTLSYAALTQATLCQKDYMPSGREVLFRIALVLLMKPDLGYVSPHLTLLRGSSEREWKKFLA